MVWRTSKKTNISTVLGPRRMNAGVQPLKRNFGPSSRSDRWSTAIADSLGWARFRQGDAARALTLIEAAAQKLPADAEVNDHLGDVYYALGRRFEARYAWRAALLTATPRDRIRINAKLTPAS